MSEVRTAERRKWPIRRLVGVGVVAILFAGWTLALRPVSLGGPATYLIIRGDSMLPTYDTGELVILRTAASYRVGEAVGYRVSDGELGAGRVVVHRIVGVGDDGTFVMEGDNNPSPDPWTPTPSDIAGAVWVAIPIAGRAIAWTHQPATVAALAAAIVVALVLSGGHNSKAPAAAGESAPGEAAAPRSGRRRRVGLAPATSGGSSLAGRSSP